VKRHLDMTLRLIFWPVMFIAILGVTIALFPIWLGSRLWQGNWEHSDIFSELWRVFISWPKGDA
jgi:hypothetical protein